MDIITDLSKLNSYITQTGKTYASAGRRVHIAVVSALWHVSKSGDVRPLNKVFEFLRSNDQQAVKMYIRRAQIINGLNGKAPDGLSNDVINEALSVGQVLGFKQGEFIVVNGHNTEQAKGLLKLVETRFINPDGKTDRYVLDRNNFAETRILGNVELLKELERLTGKIDKEMDNIQITADAKVKDFFHEIHGKTESLLQQYTLDNG